MTSIKAVRNRAAFLFNIEGGGRGQIEKGDSPLGNTFQWGQPPCALITEEKNRGLSPLSSLIFMVK